MNLAHIFGIKNLLRVDSSARNNKDSEVSYGESNDHSVKFELSDKIE